MILPEEIREGLTTVFPVKRDVGHSVVARSQVAVDYRSSRSSADFRKRIPVAGNGASHRESTYRCYLPVLTGFTDLLPRSSRRSTEFSRPPGATGTRRLSLLGTCTRAQRRDLQDHVFASRVIRASFSIVRSFDDWSLIDPLAISQDLVLR